MLTRTDCKELKDNGFPQKPKSGGSYYEDDGRLWTFSHEVSYGSDELNKYQTLAPSLSELLEACGERFACLDRVYEGHWTADYWIKKEGIDTGLMETVTGSSPEQAVARLFIQLQKQRQEQHDSYAEHAREMGELGVIVT